MSLTETIKELKDQLAEEEKKENTPSGDAAPEKEAEQPEEKPKEEPKPEEEKPKEEPKIAPKEEEPDANAYQRMRREAAAAKRLADERQSRIDELEAKLAAPKEETSLPVEEPGRPPADPLLEQMVTDYQFTRAEKEFQTLEVKFAASTPDYHDVSAEYALALAQSIKIQNPRLTNNEIAEKTKETILRKAGHHVSKGFDPIEELYQEAKELGFTGKSMKKEMPKEEPKEEEIKPDMKKVAANRAKSTGMTTATGESKGQLTKQAAADFTVAEWAKLPKEEKRRLMYG